MLKWRNTCPDVLLRRIDESYDARCYILRQTGPTGFLVKEHDVDRQFKVYLGSLHSCDCSIFKKENELCKHLLWILMKKFRIPKDSEVLYQLGLCERELNNVIYGRRGTIDVKKQPKAASAGNGRYLIKPKTVEEEDVCPICQDDIFKTKRSLIVCRFGCGNSVHTKCMKIWADHQFKSTQDEVIKCPLCRTEFGSYKSIVHEHHKVVAKRKHKQTTEECACQKCASLTSTVEAFRCIVCDDFWLCLKCFQTKYHSDHNFEFKKSPKERWLPADRKNNDVTLQLSISNFNTNERKGVDQRSNVLQKQKKKTIENKIQFMQTVRSSSFPDIRSLELSISSFQLQEANNTIRTTPSQRMSSVTVLPPLPLQRGVHASRTRNNTALVCKNKRLSRKNNKDAFVPHTSEIMLISKPITKTDG